MIWATLCLKPISNFLCVENKTRVLYHNFQGTDSLIPDHLSGRSVMSNSFVTLWTIAHQAPLSMEFSRQEYWSRQPFPGDLPNPGVKPGSSALQADSLLSESPGKPSHLSYPMKFPPSLLMHLPNWSCFHFLYTC